MSRVALALDGAKTAERCRQHKVSSATSRTCKAGFGGMDVSDATRRKVREEESARLKRPLAESVPDQVGLKAPLWRKR